MTDGMKPWAKTFERVQVKIAATPPGAELTNGDGVVKHVQARGTAVADSCRL
jgi:hypothetical protein